MKPALRAILQLPPCVQLRRLCYERQFQRIREGHLFRGVYASFAAAVASAPGARPIGYDHAAAAEMYRDRPLFPEDYAVLYWLGRLLAPGQRVFDYGGHAGSAYDCWSRYLTLPADGRWLIHDVPEVVREGQRRNAGRRGPLPEFTTDFAAASGADVLLASGSLQYVELPLAERLAALPDKPRWLLLNQLPLHPERQFVTLQNIRTCYCPYLVFHEARLFASLQVIGYQLRERWLNPGKGCYIPTYPAHTASPYHGALFELGAAAPGAAPPP